MWPIRVAGIDWATSPNKRAIVVLSSDRPGKITLEKIFASVQDEDVAQCCGRGAIDVVGVDTPFGWPSIFADFVQGWRPTDNRMLSLPSSPNFRYRLTDQIVERETLKSPLSVSSNLIGVSALAWARIVARYSFWQQIDVLGENVAIKPAICEVYPGATMAAIFPRSGEFKTDRYKADSGIRTNVVVKFSDHFGVNLSNTQVEELVGKNSDKTDAFIAALTVLMRADGVTGWSVRTPNEIERDRAQSEGWIFFPTKTQSQLAASGGGKPNH